MLKGKGIIQKFFLCMFACVLFVFGGAGVAQAYTVTYHGCNGNSWNSNDPTNAAQLPSDCSGFLGPCSFYDGWECFVDGGGYYIISFGQSLSSYLTGDMTCSLHAGSIPPTFRIRYHGGNCANPSNPTQDSPSVDEIVQNGSVSYTIKSPENLSSQNLANLYSGLDNCVSFNGYYDYYGYNTTFSCNGSNCGSFVPADQAGGVSEGCIYNVDLYMTCDWTEYSVVYHGCDGTVDQNSAVIYNGSFNVLPYEDTNLSSNGYTFQNWNTSADGSGTTYSANSTYTMNTCAVSGTTIDLYAMCIPDICTITLNPNNGTGAKQGGDSSSSTNDTKTIYSQYGDGAYKTNTNDVLSNQMTSQSGLGDTPPSPVLGIPVGRNVTWTFDAQTSAPIDPVENVQYSVVNPSDLVKQRSFVGYYSTTNGSTTAPMVWLSQNADKQCIDADGYITSYGQGLAESIAQNNGSCPTWYAQYDCKNSGNLPSVTVLGYTVTRWKDGGTNLTTVGGSKMCTDHNFVAIWQANTYTITYAPGLIGGNSVSKSVNFDANVYTDNTALAAITNPFTVPTGYIFTGWSSNYNVGTGTPTTNPMTSYDEGDSLGYYKVVGSTTMTAQWDCDTGYTWVNGECVIAGYIITLDQQGAATSSNTTTLYTTVGVGAYLESSRTNLMSTSANNITIPSKTAHTTSYNANAPQNTSVSAPGNSVATWTFNGFYESTADNSAQYIDDTGYITGDGDTIAKNLSANDTWYAKWTANCVDVQSAPTAPTGYSFGGWYKNAAGTGDAVTQICADDDFDTLYAKWGPLVVSVTYWCLNEGPGAFAYYDTEFVMQNYGGNCQPGRTFLGWKCDHDFATGEGTHGVYNYDYPLENGVITGGTVVSKATEDVWCESQWTKRVLYSCGNGTGNAPTDSNQYVAGDSVTVLDNGAGNCVPPEGYLFGRWKCNNGVGNKVATNTFSYPDVDSDVTCTAMYDFNTVFLEWNPNGGQPSSIDTPESCFYGEDNGISGIAHPTKTGYTFNGWRLTYWQCYIPEIDTSKSGSSRGYINNNGGAYFSAEEFGLTQLGTFAVRFSYGQVNGRSKCSSLSTGDNPGDDDGDYCWCKVTGVIPTDGEQCDVDYFPWLFYGHTGGSCTSNCADFCAQALRNNWDNARVYMLTRLQ